MAAELKAVTEQIFDPDQLPIVLKTQDGIISPDEIPAFAKVVDELLDLEKKIEELKLQAASMISIPAMMQKRKRPLATAAR